MKKTYSANLFFLIVIVLQIASVVFLSPIIKTTHMPVYYSILITEYLLIFLPSIIYIAATKQSIIEVLSLRPIGFASILIIILIGFLIYPLASFIGFASQLFFHNYVADAFQVFSGLPLGSTLLMLAVTPAICEETVMRGAVLSGYRNVNTHKAAIMNGFLFGIFHLNLQQFFYAFAIGVIFAYLVIITGSIFSSMLCHFICNGTSFTIAYFASKNVTQQQGLNALPDSAKIAAFISLLIAAIICCTLIILLIKALKALNKNKREYRYENAISSMQGNVTFTGSREKVMNWPAYAVIAVYVVFLVAFQFMSKVPIINK